MACPADRQIAQLLDGRLGAAGVDQLHEHVAGCAACAELLTALARAHDPDAARPTTGQSHSEYVLADRIGRGGMGVVFRAHDTQLGRTVAVKFLANGAHAPSLEARFKREALITARLQHPSIVPIYQMGSWPGGDVFYAMKLISGRSLRELIAAAPSLRGRLALLPHLLAAADAVAYAHEQHIIHRDLKPANIMAGSFGETMVIDWGLAKDLAAAEPDAAIAGNGDAVFAGDRSTRDGAVLGTPEYIAPEQARGEPVDERADVFALGAVLHHLLAGAPSPAATDRDAPPDLVAIVTKAMAGAATQRYPSARELAADLRRFATGQLVDAHAYSLGTLVRRWLVRHRLVVSVAAALVVVLVVSQALSLRRIVHERATAVAGRDALILEQAAAQLDRDPTATLVWLKRYPASGRDRARVSDLALEAAARGVARHVFRVRDAAGDFADFSRDGRWFAGRADDRVIVCETATGQTVASLPAPGHFLQLRFSPDGKRLAIVGKGEMATPVRIWDIAAGTVRVLDEHDGHADAIDWSPDGRRLASAGWDGRVHIWDVATGSARVLSGHDKPVWRVKFSADGGTLLSLTENSLWRWNLATGVGEELLRDRRLSPLFAVANVGNRVVALGDDAIVLFDLGTNARRRFAWPDKEARVLDIAGDGSFAIVGGSDGSVRRLGLDDGALALVGNQHREVSVAAIAPDGSVVATGGVDGIVRLWDGKSGELRELRAAVDGAIKDLVFAPTGGWLATSADDHTERLWQLPSTRPRVLRGHDNVVHQVVFAPDGRSLATASSDETVQLESLDGAATRTLRGHSSHVMRLAYSPDGTRLASCSFDNTVRVWNLLTGASTELRGHTAPVLAVAFAPDGATVFSASLDGTIRVWDVATGRARVLAGHRGTITELALTPDGHHLVSGGEDGTVRAWDWRAGTDRVLYAHGSDVRGIAVSPDGRFVVSGDGRGLVHVAASDGSVQRSWQQRNEVLAPTFAPTSDLFATIDGEVVRLWRPDGTAVQALVGHKTSIWRLAFSADGALLASGGFDGAVRVWDCPSGRLRAVYHGDGRISWATFSPDGRWLAASSFDTTTRLWSLDALPRLPGDERALAAWLDGFTSAALDESNLPTTPLLLQHRR
jgi:eukaryotic-like serine/threonine-protein kinase